jgi:hypothetical protein
LIAKVRKHYFDVHNCLDRSYFFRYLKEAAGFDTAEDIFEKLPVQLYVHLPFSNVLYYLVLFKENVENNLCLVQSA